MEEVGLSYELKIVDFSKAEQKTPEYKALNPRGELYSKANIKARLNMRDFMDSMRNSGVQVGGEPPPLSQRDRMEFANALDKYLAQFG